MFLLILIIIFVFFFIFFIILIILFLFFLVLLLIKRGSHHPSVCFQPQLKLSVPWLELTTELRSCPVADIPLLNITVFVVILLLLVLFFLLRADHNSHNG